MPDRNHINGDDVNGRPALVRELIGNHAAVEQARAVAGDSSFSELVGKVNQTFGGVKLSVPVIEEVLDFLADEGALSGRRHSVMANQWKVAAKLIAILTRAFKHHRTPQMFALLYIWDEPLLDDILYHQNQTQFAESIGLDKAAVNNAVIDEQRYFKMAPRRDQRKLSARATMSRRRIGQLKATHGTRITRPSEPSTQ